jgi:excisionase family DNA binding protein
MSTRGNGGAAKRVDTTTHDNYECHWCGPSSLADGIAEQVGVEVQSVEVIRFRRKELACLMDYDLVARLLGLKGERASDTVRRLVQAGELPSVRVRGQVRFMLEDVEDFIERHRS